MSYKVSLAVWLTNSHKTICYFLPLGRDSLELLSQVLLHKEKFGQLVLLGFDVTAFTPAAYQRRSLQRPSKEI